MTKRREKTARRPRRRILLLLVFAMLATLFFWFEQNAIQTERIYVSGAPQAFDGFSIAILSDVHAKEFGQDNATLLEETAALKPDIIAVTGDLIHEAEQLEMVAPLAKGLAAIAPTYYVTGNHEWTTHRVPELKALLGECGVTVLSNEYEIFERDGEKLALLGIDDPNGRADQITLDELAAQLRREEGDCYALLLAHRNNRYTVYEAARMDLTLAGHAHGGMVRLPFTDGLIGPHHEFLPEYTAGRYDLDYGQMVVSRGLGAGSWMQIRLFNRPHLPLVVLQAG